MKMTSLKNIENLILKAVEKAGFAVQAEEVHLERTKTLEQGHFATPIALSLAKKNGRRPQEVAQEIVGHLKSPLIAEAEIAGPGFINLTIEQNFYTENIQTLIKDPQIYLNEIFHSTIRPSMRASIRASIVIEYSSPNIAKPLGVHHLLSTIIGDALKRLYLAYGYRVIGENYPGDIGTQFGKLIYAIRTWGDEATIEKNPIDELLKLYVKFHDEAEKDPALEEHGRAEYKKFEEGDAKNRAQWKKIVTWSFQAIQPLYDRLGVTFDGIHGESFFEERMRTILDEGRKKGIFVDGKNGAWIVLPDDPNEPPALVKKSDGATLYLTRDLAQMEFFEETYHPDIMVWVVDVAQTLYFRQRFSTSRKLQQTPAKLVHAVFGRMSFKDEAMSTRKGNIIKLEELLDEAEKRALKVAEDKGEDLSKTEKAELARKMGIGAVKYSMLSQNRTTNITFDWDVILALEGNSAPYLMYTATRANSILKKGEVDSKKLQKMALSLSDDKETLVAARLITYPETIKRAAEEFKPNHLATYLYNLAQEFNSMYNALPVLQAETKQAKETRLLLTAGVTQVMRHALAILGIEVPQKM